MDIENKCSVCGEQSMINLESKQNGKRVFINLCINHMVETFEKDLDFKGIVKEYDLKFE